MLHADANPKMFEARRAESFGLGFSYNYIGGKAIQSCELDASDLKAWL
jgi:hypothetical protein